ncbi:MAG: phage/plasmid primase, P4 family [bacterium]
MSKMDSAEFFRIGRKPANFEVLMSVAKRPMERMIDEIVVVGSEADKYDAAGRLLKEVSKLQGERQEPYVQQLKKKFGINIGWIRERLGTIGGDGDEPQEKTLLDLAEGFVSENGPLAFLDGDIFFRFANGYFKKQEDATMECLADSFLEREAVGKRKGNVGTASRMELLNKVKVTLNVYIGGPDRLNPERMLLNFKNGMYDVVADLLLPHDEKYLSTIRLPYNFNPEAKCPRWVQFVNEALPDDSVARDFLQEFMGLCLFPITKFHVFLILVGSGGNGKSVVLHVLKHLVGVQNCSFLRIDEIGMPHKGIKLMNMLVNMATENEAKIVKDTALLKQIAAGDEEITDSEKFKPAVAFIPFTRLIFSSNNMMKFSDTSPGFRQRLRVISFDKVFRNTPKDNKNLKFELVAEEREGILQWCLEGYKRLKERGYFIESETMKEAADGVRKSSSSVFIFVDERCHVDREVQDTRENLYRAYGDFCETNGYQRVSAQKFWDDMKRAVLGLEMPEDDREMVGGRLERTVYGVCLR